MDKFVARANILHYRKKHAQATDETKRLALGGCWLRKRRNDVTNQPHEAQAGLGITVPMAANAWGAHRPALWFPI
jgi:hypothetical protein